MTTNSSLPFTTEHASARREMTLRPWLALLHTKPNNEFKERHMSPLSCPTTVWGLETEAEFYQVEIGQSRSSDHSAVAAHKNPHLDHRRQSLTVVMFAGRVTISSSSSIPSSSSLLFPSTAAAWWPRYCVRYLTVIRVQLAALSALIRHNTPHVSRAITALRLAAPDQQCD